MPDLKGMTVEELCEKALYTRLAAYEIARRLEEAQQKIVAQEANVRNIINRIPAIVNGEMIIDHYDIEGEFVGSESVDPLAVLGSVVGALEAMDYAALAAHDAELTAKAKAVALEEAINKCFDMTLYTGFDCAIALEEMAAEYRAGRKESCRDHSA